MFSSGVRRFSLCGSGAGRGRANSREPNGHEGGGAWISRLMALGLSLLFPSIGFS